MRWPNLKSVIESGSLNHLPRIVYIFGNSLFLSLTLSLSLSLCVCVFVCGNTISCVFSPYTKIVCDENKSLKAEKPSWQLTNVFSKAKNY